MEFSQLKKTDMKISKVGIGTNKVGGHNYFKNLDEQQGKDFVKEAIRLGVNFIDTADVYGLGRSEELVGEVLKSPYVKREDLIVATKGARDWNADRTSNKPEYLRSALEASLKRLDLDYVDLYYLHFPDGETPLSESVGELSRLKEEGKIRAIGVSNLDIDQLKEADENGDISALQSGYNMFDRSVEKDVLPYCAEHNISFIPYFPLASGLLTGKYTANTDFPEGDPRRERFQDEESMEKFQKVKKLKRLADTKNIATSHLALAWLLEQKGVDAVIPGGRNAEQARNNVKAGEVKLSSADLDEMNAILLG
ncbi:MAG TPA: aldo/keto reductase [Bacillales bacterium]|nr:aldo/keto reductase [Bacillales bacterium]